MKRTLITGGFGNLGSWLTKHFCEKGFEVTVLAQTRRSFLDHLHFEFIACDITNAEDCKNKLAGKPFEFVIHTASLNDTFLPDYAANALNINAHGTRNVLEAIEKSALKNFIYLSTFHVYGHVSGNVTEETAPNPRHEYASTHLFGEKYVKQFHETHQLPYTIIRLTNSYGCPLDKNSSKWYLVLNDLSKMAFEQQKIVLKSNGKPSRDFIWMGDVCEVFKKLTALEMAPNDTFNLSGEKSYTMLEFAQLVKQAYLEFSGKEIPVEINTGDKTEYTSDLFVSSAKLKKLILFQTKERFKEEAKKIFNFLS